MPEWKTRYPGVEALNVAVMGCSPVFVDGKKVATLRGPTLVADFKQMVADYIEQRFGRGAGRTAAE
jgi:(E)-4-hydroxy-3-methylbut-2-enyl-diphosphate synthase